MGETNRDTTARAIIAAPGWRRLAAYLVDYFVFIAPWLGVLALGTWVLFDFDPPIPSNPWFRHGIMLLILTGPIVLYFAVCESSRLQGTVGKRLLGIAVVDLQGERPTFPQTVMRAIVKFLPWEFFHAILWHWEGWPTNPAAPTPVQYCAMALGWLVMAWYVAGLFVGSRRTPYDRVAGTMVVRRVG